MPETPLLRIEELAVSFPVAAKPEPGTPAAQAKRRVRAVNNVSMTVYPKQTLAVVGESGCGKSVTAMSVLRLIPTPPGRYDDGAIYWQRDDKSEPVNLLEHDDRQMVAGRLRDDLEAVESRHLDVEKHEVRAFGLDGLHGRRAVLGFADDLDVGLALEAEPEPLPRQRLVVHDHGPDGAGHAWAALSRGTPVRYGSRTRTRPPPSGAVPASKACASP